MLHVRTHRLELARNRIERDLKRLAIEHSREPRSGTFKPNLELKPIAVQANGLQTPTKNISRRNEMASQIGDTAPDCELEHHNGARPNNWGRGRGQDIIIAGAISEWVLMG